MNKESKLGESKAGLDLKKKLWEETTADVETITDGVGKRIDKDMKDAVIGLNILDIHTFGSCEGYIDWGTGGPYVDIVSKEYRELWKRAKNAVSEEEAKKFTDELESKNLEERKKIFDYLSDFYKDRQVPFHQRLTIQGLAKGWSRLESQGVGLQKIEPEEVKKQHLKEFQEEINAFTEYLKNRFFEN
jgi:hypothetical protein